MSERIRVGDLAVGLRGAVGVVIGVYDTFVGTYVEFDTKHGNRDIRTVHRCLVMFGGVIALKEGQWKPT